MAVLRPRVPIRFESVAKMVNGHDLKSLIVPVEEGLRKFHQLYDFMMSSLCGAFLILRGDTGSGKTTLLHTLGLFLKDVQTVSIRRDESIRESLRNLGPYEGMFRVVVIESREALSDTSDVEIESIILASNTFVRTAAGERTVVVWPCNSDPIAEKLVASARQIGGEALWGLEEPVFRYHGPPRREYLPIARKTIARFNSGASLADLGISEDRAEQLAHKAETIGTFLRLLQVEERRNRELLASTMEAREQCRMWVVVVAKNDPEAEVGVLTRGQYSTADVERLMASTDANIVKEIKEHPERLGLLGTAFDAKILYMPALTAIEVLQEYADDPLRNELAKQGFSVSGATDGKGRLLDSDLASALQGEPVGTLKRGRKPQSDRLAPFDAIMTVAQTNDSALNRAVGKALVDCGLIERFDQEVDLGGGLTRKSDLVCNPHIDPVRLEMMWRRDTTRSEIANYVLTKLFNYGRAIGFIQAART
jgi:energy-coupling factor transporter ATP-binding protein EcfA2